MVVLRNNAQSKRLLKKILFLDIITTWQKGVTHVYYYILNFEINKNRHLVMVVDCINIVVGWWFLWSYFVIHTSQNKNGTQLGAVYFCLFLHAI